MPTIYRPAFHFSPPQGWLNDPNGLVFYKGLWHLFYQHQPSQITHGPMHWGHAVSRDLASWEHWPIALHPDELGTIWSGSAAVEERDDGTTQLVACFTQAEGARGQVQSLAFSRDEGRTWHKYEGNPVVTSERPDFRDPKIFRHHGRWIMVVSGGHEAHFYASDNLFDWTLLSTFPSPQPGWIWECPDLFEIDGQWILIVSFIVPGGSVAEGSRTHFWIGDFDGERFLPRSSPQVLSFGPDDYAAVSWSDAPDDRRVIIGWASHWAYANQTPTQHENWRGAMTLPRELSIRGGTLCQLPPREVLAVRGEAIAFDESGTDFRGDAYEIQAEIDIANLQGPAGFRLRVGAGEATPVLFDPAAGELCIDRTQSGQSDFHADFAGVFRAPLEVEGGVLKLHIFVDRCSVEVFAQDGALYGAALIFPSENSRGIEFVGAGTRVKGTITRLAHEEVTHTSKT
jgi:sucrose-6-phosphate hydrolase SacC (GH32 family)